MQSVSKAHQNRQYLYGILMASIGSVLFSGKAILIKLAFAQNASAETLMALRLLMALPLFGESIGGNLAENRWLVSHY